MDISEVMSLALGLRRAIEKLEPNERPSSMFAFPKGACGDSSLILGAYLTDRGVSGFNYICGERGRQDMGTWTTHAWLAKDELMVDITADQFPDAPAPVIVSKTSAWHKSFTTDTPTVSDFRDYAGPSIPELAQFYARLKLELFQP